MNTLSISMLRLLCNLRWLAIAGQAMTVALVAGPLGLTLFHGELWSGIVCLALFNVYATWRAWYRSNPGELETYAHVLVDVAALTWLILWSGGADNPFSSLFLLPIAIAVLVLYIIDAHGKLRLLGGLQTRVPELVHDLRLLLRE